MRKLIIALQALLFLAQLLLAGCAANAVRDTVSRGSAQPDRGLGRTVLICQAALPPGTPKADEKTGRLEVLGAQVLGGLPSARPVPAGALLERLGGRDPSGLGDRELAAVARETGADTVVLVRVVGFGGSLTVSLLPPYWMVTTDYAYQARVIDARSGALYLDAYRGRKSGGAFNALGAADLEQAFSADLADLLARASGPASDS